MIALTLCALISQDATGTSSGGGRLVSGDGPALEVVLRTELPTRSGRWPVLDDDGAGGLLALWTEPRKAGHSLRLARYHDGSWGEPETLATGNDWFVNWADFPQLASAGDGRAWVSWLRRLGETPYAYGVRVKRSPVGKGHWLHDDTSPTEHGFVSLVPLQGGRLFSAWLDGRATAEGAPMTLRAAVVDGDGVPGPSFLVDDRVCDCCQTDAAQLADGRILLAWRDRSDEEVRDISWSVGRPEEPGSWSEPRLVHGDGWRIPGCPVNGPAVCAGDSGAAIAWFSMLEGERPAVHVVISREGLSFDEPVRLDSGLPLGRVDCAFLEDGTLIVAWMEQTSEGAEWRLRALAGGRNPGPPLVLGQVSGERSDGFLRLTAHAGGVAAAFVDGSRVRLLRVEPAR